MCVGGNGGGGCVRACERSARYGLGLSFEWARLCVAVCALHYSSHIICDGVVVTHHLSLAHVRRRVDHVLSYRFWIVRLG